METKKDNIIDLKDEEIKEDKEEIDNLLKRLKEKEAASELMETQKQ